MNLNQKLTEAIDKLIPEEGLIVAPCEERKVLEPYWREEELKVGEQWLSNSNSSTATRYIEPELRHVMWALKAAKHFYIYVNTEGEFVDESPLNGYPETLGFYDLTKSLYKQTEELRQWLLNLLTE